MSDETEPGQGAGAPASPEDIVSARTDREEQGGRADGPAAIARRTVLARGARLAYIVPAVLAAMSAKQAFALS